MPNSEKIEQLISPEALKQFEQLKSASDANTASFEKLIAKAVELNKAVGNATTFKEINKATVEMTENEKALAKQITDLEKANAKLQALYADEAKKIAEVKVQQQEQNKILKEQAKEALGLVGAYDKLTKEYNEAAKEAKNLAAQFGAGSKQAQEASKRALELDARLKAADANVGRYNKNVGNYSGALDTLKGALQDVSKRINELKLKGDQTNNTTNNISNTTNKATTVIRNYNTVINDNTAAVEALEKEQSLLQSLIDAQSKGFANATSEIRNNQQAILLLTQVYGEDSEVITELTKKTAELSDTVGDMKATIKAQASDTKVFDGLIAAAQGLVGVYSVAQGAAALFGDENEELQKTFVKLQAIMSVLQGLQAIQNALQKENAARQLVSIGLQKITVLQTNLQTAAESRSIIVRYAAIAAQKALNAAMSLAGGPLLAIIGLLALVLISLSSFSSASVKAARDFAKLNEEFKGFENLLNDRIDLIKQAGDVTIAELEAQFADEKKIRDARRKSLVDESSELKKFLVENADAYREAFDISESLTQAERAGKELSEKEKKNLEEALKFVDQYTNVRKRSDAAEIQLEVNKQNNIKETTEENIKARQEEIEVYKTQIQTRQQIQQSIVADERKSQADRINALKESRRLQEQIINADANSKRLTTGLTPSQIGVIEAQRTAALTQARRESNKAIEDLNRSYAERERKARFDIVRTEIEDQIKAADLIAQSEKNSFDKRLDALYEGYTKRRDIVIAQHDLEIQNDTLTAEERIAIEKKYISDINQLTVDYGLQQQQLYQQNTDKVNEIIEKGQQGRLDRISAQQSLELIALTESFRSGNISSEDYAKQRANIEQKYRIISLKEEINNATAKVLATKEGTAERFAAEKELADKTLALNDEVTQKQIDAQQRLNDARKQFATEAFDTFNSLVNIQFDNESGRIQQQIDELEKRKQKEINVAEQTIQNKQEREIEISKIEAKAQAERERLEKRQQGIEIQRAKFNKASALLNIAVDTAQKLFAIKAQAAVLAANPVTAPLAGVALAQIPFVIASSALAAGLIAAQPLPKFEHGIDDAPGGLAIVGEKRKELIVTPEGNVIQTPAVPTVMNVPKHSIVLPDARAALESGLAVNRHGRLIQQDNADIKDVGRKIDTLTKVIKNKPTLNMSADQGGLTAMWQYGANWVLYAEDQTRF